VSCVPPPCGRTFGGGISGLAISHKPSGNSTFPAPYRVNVRLTT
jgi:hypothetical protein